MSVQGKDQFHTGMIVDDLDASADELTRTAGLHWSPRIDTEVPIWSPDGRIEVHRMVATYSVEAPHLELITATPGSLWDSASRPLHHFGYWSDDLLEESAELERLGLRRVAAATVNDTFYGFSYHVTRDGLFLELVDRAVFPDWQGFLKGNIAFGSST